MQPRQLLHLEGIALFVAASAAYFLTRGGGLLYIALFLAPDLSIAGYLAGDGVDTTT